MITYTASYAILKELYNDIKLFGIYKGFLLLLSDQDGYIFL